MLKIRMHIVLCLILSNNRIVECFIFETRLNKNWKIGGVEEFQVVLNIILRPMVKDYDLGPTVTGECIVHYSPSAGSKFDIS